MTDAAQFARNRNKFFPPDVMRPYLGYVVAWSDDGTQMLGFARTYEELYADMDRRGITDFVGDGSIADADPIPETPARVAAPASGAHA